jgi:hypothetical protein
MLEACTTLGEGRDECCPPPFCEWQPTQREREMAGEHAQHVQYPAHDPVTQAVQHHGNVTHITCYI